MSTLIAEFTVTGTPVPQGSTRAFAGKGKAAGKVFTTNDPQGTIARWRADIRAALRAADATTMLPADPRLPVGNRAVSMRLSFRMPRPKSHFLPANSKRPEPVLRDDAPTWAAGKPDIDRLERAVLDALTGLCYVDDEQVVVVGKTKAYANPGEQPGVDVRVSALDG